MLASVAFPAAWYVVGPAIGLVVVAMAATLNVRMGVVGGVSEVVDRLRGGRAPLGWRACFVLGVVLGGAIIAAVHGGVGPHSGYGWLSRRLRGHDRVALPIALVGAGALIGYGAKTAGGCTSGNGLAGCATGSPASLVATGSFMATAIAVTFALRAVFG